MPDEQNTERRRGEVRGQLVWRAIRYLSAVFAGYLFGLAAGSSGLEAPGWWMVAIVGAAALLLIFRAGAKSQSHAAVDAVMAARAEAQAAAAAVSTQTVTIAGGHVVGAAPSAVEAAPEPAPLRVRDRLEVVGFNADGSPRYRLWTQPEAEPETLAVES